jgi:hypothetical protein
MALTKPRAYQIYDIDYKQATRVITVANVTLSGGAPSQIDGVNLSLDDRVLVTGQTNKSQNGIYEVATVGSGVNGTWVRSGDTNTTGELLAGTIVMVTEGLIYADTQWKLTTNDPITIGVSELVFEQNSAFAFGNVNANGTAVLANSVGSTINLTAGNNIQITGNNTSKTVTIGVTGISLNSISNGTSNVNVVSSGGNVTVGVAGTGNVAVFSSSGLAVSGNITGNGSGLSGINAFSTVAVTGGNSAVADSISDTLTITAGSGIALVMDSSTDTLTIAASGTGESIFATGGDMELITNTVTNSLDLGLVTEAVTENNDLGGFFIEGFVGNDNFLPNSINGNVLLANAVIETTGNITAGYFIGNGSALTGVVAGAPNAVVNGTTNISTTTNGNANITIGGTSNVAVFSTTGLAITGVSSATGNITGGNVTTAGQVVATGNITGGNVIATTTVYGNAATAFVAGSAAISGVALQMPQEGALRNLTNGLTNMYFDVSIGGSTNGQFQFRSSNAFTNVLTMSPTVFNVNTNAVVTSRTPSFGRLPWNSAIDTELTVDDYRFRVNNTGGNIYPQVISNTGGTKNSAWTAVAAISGSAIAQGGNTGVFVANNAWTNLYTFGSMNSAGDTITVTFQDKPQGRIYRVTFMRSDNGATTGYNIIAERLL